jgi:hypothetical protein
MMEKFKKRLNPECSYDGMIEYHPRGMRRGLASLTGMFEGSVALDGAVRRRRGRQASTRVGSPTQAAQSLAQITQRDCPWQLWSDPETGVVQIQRRYNPEDEPLTNHTFENTFEKSEVD